jgi:hypothetical protein
LFISYPNLQKSFEQSRRGLQFFERRKGNLGCESNKYRLPIFAPARDAFSCILDTLG